MLEIPGFYERDWQIVQQIVKQGYLNEAAGRKINHIECNLFLGYFKYVQETNIKTEEIPILVQQFMDEIKDIMSLYVNLNLRDSN